MAGVVVGPCWIAGNKCRNDIGVAGTIPAPISNVIPGFIPGDQSDANRVRFH